MTDGELRDRIAAAARDAEAGPDVDIAWVPHREPSKSPTAVYSVRIPVDRIEELRQLAAARSVAPTALIRAWVLAQLDAAQQAGDQAGLWERDFRATAEHLRALLDERPIVPVADTDTAPPR